MKISVIMSVFNETLEWLKEAVESILNQTYQNLEFIIIVDNPNLPLEINHYLEDIVHRDIRVSVGRNRENIGLAKSLNRGIELATGEYIARMDADDVSLPDRMLKEIQYLKLHNLDLVSSNKYNIDEHGNILSQDHDIIKNPNLAMPYVNLVNHPSVLAKRSVIKEMGGYRPFINSEDYDLWLRIIEAGYKIGIINEPLIQYRLRKNSASIGRQLEQFYIAEYIRQLHYERKRYGGTDSFSIENMYEFLKGKNINGMKKEKYMKAKLHINDAVDYIYIKKCEKALKEMILAFYFFPPLAIRETISYVKTRRK